MKLKLNYIDKIVNVPEESLMANIGELTLDELKVYLFACSSSEFRADADTVRAKAIKVLDMQWAAIELAVNSLCSKGLLLSDEFELPESAKEVKKKPKASVKADSPVYSKDETAGIIERNADLYKIINDDVPRIIGKAVSQNESMIMVAMYDYLRMSSDSIVKIVSYCASRNMFSFRLVERTAYSLFDRDMTDPESIDAFIKEETRKAEITEKIKDLFGIGKRTLIQREKNLINTWSENYGYGMDVINRAYEITITNINEPSLDYAGAIMKNWHEKGLKTLSEIDNDIAERAKSQPAVKPQKNGKAKHSTATSFDTDEFLVAAMQRSYKDKKG